MARMMLTLTEDQVGEAVRRWVEENVDGLHTPEGGVWEWRVDDQAAERALVIAVEVEPAE